MEIQVDPQNALRKKMEILYNVKTDLFYLRLDEQKQQVMNRRVSEDIVLDIGEDEKIVGIEILDASKRLTLERLLSVKYEVLLETVCRERVTAHNRR